MAPDSGGHHVYRTGLSSACRRRDTCARLREIARACHAIKFATGEVFSAYAASLAESGSDWEAGDEKKKVYPFLNLQSFVAYGGDARAEKLPPLLRAAAERFAKRSPEAVARSRAFGKIPGLSKVLHYQADSMCTAFCNMLEYGADSLHRRVAVAKHGLDRAEARAVARCLGSDQAERVLRAKEARLKSAGRAASAAVAFSSEEEIGAALLSDACSRFDAPRRAKVEAAVAAMAARLPSESSLVAKFRYRAALSLELDEAIAREPTCGAARAALFPRTSFKPGFVRVDKAFGEFLGAPVLRGEGASFMLKLFDSKKLKRMLTKSTVLGATFMTDGVQLQVEVLGDAAARRKERKDSAAAGGRVAAKRRREDGAEDRAEPAACSAPKRKAREAAAARPPAPRAPRDAGLSSGGFESWTGVDPGHKNVYTARRDFPDGRRPETWGLSLGAYYDGIGHSRRGRALLRAKEGAPRVRALELELAKLDSARSNKAAAEASSRARCEAFTELAEFYSRPSFLRLDFEVAMKKEKLVAEHAKRLAPGPRHRLFWGNAAFSFTRKGTLPAACALIRKAAERRAGAAFSLADEFRTSCVCSSCFSFMDKALGQLPSGRGRRNVARPGGRSRGAEGGRARIHGVMQCRRAGCGHTWNRDVNAAANILYVAVTLPEERHPHFSRCHERQRL